MTRKRNSENELTSATGAAAAPVRRKTAPRTRVDASEPQAEAALTPEIPAATASAQSGPTYHEVAALAYSYWVERGYQGGSPQQDWLRAEEELRTRAGAVTA